MIMINWQLLLLPNGFAMIHSFVCDNKPEFLKDQELPREAAEEECQKKYNAISR